MPTDNWVKALGLDADGTLFVEVDNGLRFFDICANSSLPAAINIHPEDLMQAGNRALYHRFLATLKEIESVLIHSTYEGTYQFKRGEVVVDAGARIGSFTTKASAAVGEQGIVIAIEPEPQNFACLQKNIRANQLTNVVPIQKMLWSEARRMPLFLSENATSHSAYCDAFYGSTGDSVVVDAEPLDLILAALGIGPVNFVKMDIEGAEIEAIRGMKQTLASNLCLAIAAYHPVNGNLTYTEIMPRLRNDGFITQYVDGIIHAQRQRRSHSIGSLSANRRQLR